MKRIFSLLLPALFFTGACKNSAKKMDAGTPAQMDFKELTYNFGTVPNGSVNKCSFKFQNTSRSLLIINNVIVSCGCTSPQWPKKPIAPGENGIIEIRYNAAGVGLFSKSVSVFSNAGNSPVHLYIKGEITL